jgi:hypothetical protein
VLLAGNAWDSIAMAIKVFQPGGLNGLTGNFSNLGPFLRFMLKIEQQIQ